MAELNKRIMVRVSEDQLAWIGQMAADEGMDNATFVRVVIDRLSKGRAPLISMMATRIVPVPSGPPGSIMRPDEPQTLARDDNVQELLAQRTAEAEENLPEPGPALAAEQSGAIPLRRLAREVYNPRPK
jgi:hypothetical protein